MTTQRKGVWALIENQVAEKLAVQKIKTKKKKTTTTLKISF